MRKGIQLAGLLICLCLVASGCVPLHTNATNNEAGIRIRTENLKSLVKNQSTKSDVIALFGMPVIPSFGGGSLPSNFSASLQTSQTANQTKDGTLSSEGSTFLTYGHCITTTGEDGWFFPPFTMPDPGKADKRCEKLSVMLDKKDIVKAIHYHAHTRIIDVLRDEDVRKITNGKTDRVELAELFGAPEAVTPSGSDEVYNFKECEMRIGIKASILSVGGVKMEEVCSQLSVIVDKKSGIVKASNYQPAPKLPAGT